MVLSNLVLIELVLIDFVMLETSQTLECFVKLNRPKRVYKNRMIFPAMLYINLVWLFLISVLIELVLIDFVMLETTQTLECFVNLNRPKRVYKNRMIFPAMLYINLVWLFLISVLIELVLIDFVMLETSQTLECFVNLNRPKRVYKNRMIFPAMLYINLVWLFVILVLIELVLIDFVMLETSQALECFVKLNRPKRVYKNRIIFPAMLYINLVWLFLISVLIELVLIDFVMLETTQTLECFVNLNRPKRVYKNRMIFPAMLYINLVWLFLILVLIELVLIDFVMLETSQTLECFVKLNRPKRVYKNRMIFPAMLYINLVWLFLISVLIELVLIDFVMLETSQTLECFVNLNRPKRVHTNRMIFPAMLYINLVWLFLISVLIELVLIDFVMLETSQALECFVKLNRPKRVYKTRIIFPAMLYINIVWLFLILVLIELVLIDFVMLETSQTLECFVNLNRPKRVYKNRMIFPAMLYINLVWLFLILVLIELVLIDFVMLETSQTLECFVKLNRPKRVYKNRMIFPAMLYINLAWLFLISVLIELVLIDFVMLETSQTLECFVNLNRPKRVYKNRMIFPAMLYINLVWLFVILVLIELVLIDFVMLETSQALECFVKLNRPKRVYNNRMIFPAMLYINLVWLFLILVLIELVLIDFVMLETSQTLECFVNLNRPKRVYKNRIIFPVMLYINIVWFFLI